MLLKNIFACEVFPWDVHKFLPVHLYIGHSFICSWEAATSRYLSGQWNAVVFSVASCLLLIDFWVDLLGEMAALNLLRIRPVVCG